MGAPCLAPRRALLLRRAVGVEVVELAAGEFYVVDPLAVLFLGGSLDFGQIVKLSTAPVVERVIQTLSEALIYHRRTPRRAPASLKRRKTLRWKTRFVGAASARRPAAPSATSL